ncbi:MAG: thiol reductase thioredoxin [Zetaproteobacteria bacterium CG_4_9_14_3_um_filter_49_83]|nr:MAG: thioredoxin [Zetaproteobacteria bacterium CG1_02_49_23]PIQ34400.1 MAG: thiol reductase thioredoxin [Zetaproteobacteria bacterium CG17_big_fil_post_rev_8_21_14_2_50_50_13]PIV30284.1 MAG: thiol reductase thioredoxin [Zetaproteobacteria bacterium CG02_land_8_20_14_3_00_50_9]PIY56384.1 MAG: thiol reductase thioredoxin [Zetaproteobacteria bacterium CG_4_10_14_0_8_um_filter_49_80]PJA34024.1 MAG: thiol reductase thioredoxin [Zetaproteobacteria bacterium CG_4_9_14_3_um_filter_49_83]
MAENIHIVCAQCSAVNRLAADKLAMTANCGKCKQALLDGRVTSLEQQGFDKFITNNDLPVVVDFWAPWCGPCKMMAPTFEKVARELKSSFRFAKVNTEQQQALAARFAIRSIPTLAVFRQGREVSRQSGSLDAASLKRWVTSA